ncbi:hypothetical protein IW140_001125 [Coemansia sp. RSA 1813]|nr:hypothetical protein EV178_002350 [Coemansia sp. RSA 1646]KAJ1773155.1 hypothetical protein LPJ74_000894 [Coemansia sp. RSA 1843]KAJ2092033.1 hypothetical protein IW138_001399 [Coemansia sp. RSA 986]KAJ2216631.1 hypothetical protein EV179_001170 [Coemansia sp. RSA 487]KAJ2572085.1 hypothetical protein IW140_001125 [Coemansia sp. RSA 1813]
MKTSQFVISASALLVAVASAQGIDKKENTASVSQQTGSAASPSTGIKPADISNTNGPKNVKVDAKDSADKKPQTTGNAKDKHIQSKEKERRNAKETMGAAPDSNGATRQVGASAALAGVAALLGTFF